MREQNASEAKRPGEPSGGSEEGRGTEEEAGKATQDWIQEAPVKHGRGSEHGSSRRKPLKAEEEYYQMGALRRSRWEVSQYA